MTNVDATLNRKKVDASVNFCIFLEFIEIVKNLVQIKSNNFISKMIIVCHVTVKIFLKLFETDPYWDVVRPIEDAF